MKKNFLKIFIFFIIIFLTPKVFAQDFTVDNSNITSPNSGGTGKYTGTEIYNSGTSNVYNIGTRYNGQLSRIIFNLSAGGYADANGFEKGHTYTLTMNMATDDWRNKFGSVSVKCEGSSGQELSNGRVTYISNRKIKFSFTAPSSSWCQFVYVDLKSSNITSTAFTGVSNWNLSSMVISDPAYDSSGGGSSGGGSSGTTSNNQDIIDGANKNTQDIVNNQTQNTNDIIENNNQNTQDIIKSIDDNFKSCSLGSNLFIKTNINNGYYLNSSGVITSTSGWFVTDYISVTPNTTYEISGTTVTGGSNLNLCFYTSSKTLINCIPHNDYVPPKQITTPNNAYYFADSVYNSDINTYSFKQLNCKNKLDVTNDYLQDDSDPNIADSEFTNLFNTVGFNDPLSYLLQLPVQFINQLVSQSNTCQTISLGTLWGVSLSLPCIDIGSIIGQQVWDIIDVLFSVGLLVVIFKNLYQTFANLMTMGGEKEAREKFSMPTPMEFLSIILGGDR